jgi:hypothetical protein
MTTGLLITTAGQAAITADLGGGADLVLSQVAFGDANGVPYVPNEAQTALVNERYRATIASVSVVAGAIVVDAVIPADTPDGSSRPSHGFNIAEAGLYSAAGTLIGVAQMGNGYKPSPSSGQSAIATFRFKLAVANPSAITVVIDPQAQVQLGRNVRPFWMVVDGVSNAPPGAPALGDTYVIGAAPTGAWAGFANRLAQWVGVWSLASVPAGHLVCDQSKAENDSGRFMKRTATGWVSASASDTAFGLALLARAADIVAGTSTARVPHVDGMAEAIQSGRWSWAVATGTANAWEIAPARALAAYAGGRVLWIKPPATNTSTTVNANVSALGNRRIKRRDGSDPAIGDLVAGSWYPTIDDGANICIVSPLPSERQIKAQIFRAPAATNSVPSGVTTKITNFGTIKNTLSDLATWDAANQKLTIAAGGGGFYDLSLALDTNLDIGTDYGMSLSVTLNGGPSIAGFNQVSRSAAYKGPFGSASRSIELAVGDYLEVVAGHNFGSSQDFKVDFVAKFVGRS